MASFSSSDNFFAKFLPLLGFEEGDKVVLHKDLFVVPNKDAFQKVNIGIFIKKVEFSQILLIIFQIVHFLFEKIDKSRAEVEFRDCWPIFDKKMEADFRRLSYNWYKELQVSTKQRTLGVLAIKVYTSGFPNFKKNMSKRGK